ncbi:MAG TPA: hypothetical protein DCQ11_10805, partial [Gammaproteobacteria bacterium]|nr:hypothetical protein [Gammaproteobacteria bacterium]
MGSSTAGVPHCQQSSLFDFNPIFLPLALLTALDRFGYSATELLYKGDDSKPAPFPFVEVNESCMKTTSTM